MARPKLTARQRQIMRMLCVEPGRGLTPHAGGYVAHDARGRMIERSVIRENTAVALRDAHMLVRSGYTWNMFPTLEARSWFDPPAKEA